MKTQIAKFQSQEDKDFYKDLFDEDLKKEHQYLDEIIHIKNFKE